MLRHLVAPTCPAVTSRLVFGLLTVLLGLALLLGACGTTSPSPRPPATGTTVATVTPTAEMAEAVPPTAGMAEVMTTSPVFASHSEAASQAAQRLGQAVISYLAGEVDLAALQALVPSSAQEDLANMLTLLVKPRACKIVRASASELYSEVDVGLLFADGSSENPEFTLTVLVGTGETTVASIQPVSFPDPAGDLGPSRTKAYVPGSLLRLLHR